MRPVRSTGLFGACVFCVYGVAAALQAAWALPGSPPLRVSEAQLELPVPFACSFPAASLHQHLQGQLSPLEPALFADAADGRWDEHTLLGAALVASGVTDAEARDRYAAQFDRLAAELARSGKVTGQPQERAQAVFELMHGRILHGGYQVDYTNVALALDEGRFNCVSASVLFHCLAGRFGMTVRGLEIPGHAMSRLILPGGLLDVETTCPDWFRLLDDPKKRAELVERTLGVQPSAARRPEEAREVSDVELVATIYYNRGVDLLAEKRFGEAAAANAKALRLDPSSATARGNLLATLNNWAIDLDCRGRRGEAVDLLRQAVALDPQYETFRVNYRHLHARWIEELCQAERFEEALDVIARAVAGGIDEPWFCRLRLDVYRCWARACFETGEIDRAFAVFDRAKRRHGDSPDVLEAELAEVNCRASALLRQQHCAEAVVLLDRALRRRPESKALRENRRAAVMRWAQPAFQNGDFGEAIRRTVHGAMPGELDQALTNNVRYGYQQWISRLLSRGLRVEAGRVARQAMADPFLAGRADGPAGRFDGQ